MAGNPFGGFNYPGNVKPWTNPDTGKVIRNFPQPGTSTNPMNAYFTQLADPRYRKAMQQQNLFSNLLNFGAQMKAAGAPSLDPGYAGRTSAGAWAGLGKGLMSGNQAHQNQLIQAIKLKQLMRQNEIAQVEAKRKAELFPLQKAKLKAQTVPPPMFGTGALGKSMAIVSKGNEKNSDGTWKNPDLRSSSLFEMAVSQTSQPRTIRTDQGLVTYPAITNPAGQPYIQRQGQVRPDVTPDVTRPEPTITAQTAEQKLDLTPAERSIDLAFGKQYEKQIVAGGQADFDKNVRSLDGVLSQLRTSDDLTGPMIGILSPTIKEFTYPKAAQAQETVEEVVQRNLRIILGAQFTAEEGKRLIKRAYNPSLQEPQNVERLERLINAMKKAREAQMAANEYFQEHGTLKGYKGTKIFSLNTIESAAGLTPGESDEEIGPPPKGVTLEEWRAMTPENRKLF
jgi:hypothetical protein